MLTGPPPRFHGTRDILSPHCPVALCRWRSPSDSCWPVLKFSAGGEDTALLLRLILL